AIEARECILADALPESCDQSRPIGTVGGRWGRCGLRARRSGARGHAEQDTPGREFPEGTHKDLPCRARCRLERTRVRRQTSAPHDRATRRRWQTQCPTFRLDWTLTLCCSSDAAPLFCAITVTPAAAAA